MLDRVRYGDLGLGDYELREGQDYDGMHMVRQRCELIAGRKSLRREHAAAASLADVTAQFLAQFGREALASAARVGLVERVLEFGDGHGGSQRRACSAPAKASLAPGAGGCTVGLGEHLPLRQLIGGRGRRRAGAAGDGLLAVKRRALCLSGQPRAMVDESTCPVGHLDGWAHDP